MVKFCEINGLKGLKIESMEKYDEVVAKARKFLQRTNTNIDYISGINFWTAMR